MCICTTRYANVKPTERALKLGKLLYYIMLILMVLMICGLIGGYMHYELLTEICLIITGLCGVRNHLAYNIEQIVCVTVASGYMLVYTTVNLIVTTITYTTNVTIPALISLFGGVIFYAAACCTAKMLYDELRCNYQQVTDANLSEPFSLKRIIGQQRYSEIENADSDGKQEEDDDDEHTTAYTDDDDFNYNINNDPQDHVSDIIDCSHTEP